MCKNDLKIKIDLETGVINWDMNPCIKGKDGVTPLGYDDYDLYFDKMLVALSSDKELINRFKNCHPNDRHNILFSIMRDTVLIPLQMRIKADIKFNTTIKINEDD